VRSLSTIPRTTAAAGARFRIFKENAAASCALLLAVIPVLSFLGAAAGSGPTWQRSYFYDEADSSFNIIDIACPSERFCLAVGAIEENAGRTRPYGLITRDGGEHWNPAKPEDFPVSLFFLNETEGWMVAERGLWSTQNAGQTWKKTRSGTGYLAVAFTDPQHGWLAGSKRLFETTSDGGAHWAPVTQLTQYAGFPADLSFEYVHFHDPPDGEVVGETSGSDDRSLPDWMNPEMARYRTPARGGVFGARTSDGGRTWTPKTIDPRRRLAVAAFPGPGRDWFGFVPPPTDLHSEITEHDWKSGESNTRYRMDDARISDVETGSDGSVVVAAVEVAGRLADTPVPAKVRILKGASLSDLRLETVDYRAVAKRIVLARAGSHWFAATDTGMILRRK